MNIQVRKGNEYGRDKTACRRKNQPTKPVSACTKGWAGHTRLPGCVNHFGDVAAGLGTAGANPAVGAGVPGPRSTAGTSAGTEVWLQQLPVHLHSKVTRSRSKPVFLNVCKAAVTSVCLLGLFLVKRRNQTGK